MVLFWPGGNTLGAKIPNGEATRDVENVQVKVDVDR